MESEIDCTVCVATKNRRYINRFLNSLFDHADPVSLQVIVVNMGAEKSLDFIADNFPDVIIFESNVEETPAKAWNRALRLGRGRYVSIWHDEALLQAAALPSLIDFLDDNPDVGLAGPQLVTLDDRPLVSAALFPSFFSLLFSGNGLVRAKFPVPEGNSPAEMDWLPGICLVVNSQAVDDIGFFDERFSCYESLEYCWRLHRAGWHVHLVPASRVAFRPPVFDFIATPWPARFQDGLFFFYKKWFCR